MSLVVLALLGGVANAGEFAGTLKDYGLEKGGGLGGAPEGMAFILPPGAAASATFGALSDGAEGIRLEVNQPGDGLVCTQSVPLGPQAFFRARVQVPQITAGTASWMGMNVELRARDGMGALVGQYVLIRNVREPIGWQDIEQRLPIPAGASQGEFCFRFVLSTGVVEIDKISIVSKMDGSPAAPPPAATVAAAPAAPPPAAAPPKPAPAPPAPVATKPAPPPPTPTKAAKGKEPVAEPPRSTAAVAPLLPAGASGFSLRLDIQGSSVGCTQWAAPSGPMRITGRAAISVINPDPAGWSGLGIEGYARDAQGRAINVNGSPWASLFVSTNAGPEQDFAADWSPPPDAARVRVCARFADAAGTVDFSL